MNFKLLVNLYKPSDALTQRKNVLKKKLLLSFFVKYKKVYGQIFKQFFILIYIILFLGVSVVKLSHIYLK